MRKKYIVSSVSLLQASFCCCAAAVSSPLLHQRQLLLRLRETATPTPEGGVVIDSPLVGQWVPIGVNGKGYMSFLADGTMVRFEEEEKTPRRLSKNNGMKS